MEKVLNTLDTKEESVLSVCSEGNEDIISYRLKCSESGNGLSHYIMYGDVPEESE